MIQKARPVSILGLGNIEKGDDGIGVLVVEGLRQELDTGLWVPGGDRELAVIAAGLDSLLAAAHAADDRWVILVDAAHMNLRAGEFRMFRPTDAELSSNGDLSPHDADLGEALHLMEGLGCAERVLIMGIECEDMGEGRGLSRQLQAHLPEMQAKIKEEVGLLP
jgi:hydrogenase maturation protease